MSIYSACSKWTQTILIFLVFSVVKSTLQSGSLCPSSGFLAFLPQDTKLSLYSILFSRLSREIEHNFLPHLCFLFSLRKETIRSKQNLKKINRVVCSSYQEKKQCDRSLDLRKRAKDFRMVEQLKREEPRKYGKVCVPKSCFHAKQGTTLPNPWQLGAAESEPGLKKINTCSEQTWHISYTHGCSDSGGMSKTRGGRDRDPGFGRVGNISEWLYNLPFLFFLQIFLL